MKNTYATKLTFKLSLSLATVFVLLVSSTPCRAEKPPKAIATEDMVKFTFGGLPVDAENMVVALASAIKEHPKAKRFRTDWKYNEGGGSGEGAVLYERNSQTLKYYGRDFDSSGVSTSLYVYSNVTDNRLQEAAADLNDAERREARIRERQNKPRVSMKTVFDGLLRYGAHVKGGWRYRGWDEKEPSLRG